MDVLRVGLASYGLQGLHLHPSHSDSKNLDAGLPGFSRDLLHSVLRSPVCHDHSDPWDLQALRSSPLLLGERYLHSVLDGQAGHGAGGQMPHVSHSVLHLGFGGVGVERELRLDHAAILQQPHAGGIGANVEKLQQVNDEGLDLVVVFRSDAPGAVDNEDEIQRRAFTRILCKSGRGLRSG